MPPTPKRSVLSWALYDWANSAFATTVMAGFFPIFFKTYASEGTPVTLSSARLGIANTLGVLFVALAAPVFGAMADSGGYKKQFLAVCTYLGVLATAGLAWVPPGGWQAATCLYAFAGFFFAGALCFYDSLLPTVAERKTIDYVSALGYALGYFGGGLLFAVNVWMFQSPATFGIADKVSAVKASFITVAAWWGLFAIPLWLWVPEKRPSATQPLGYHLRRGLSEMRHTVAHLSTLKTVLFFLAAFYCYNDGVGTVMKMAIDYGISIGLKTSHLIGALLLVQFIGFPSTLIFGKVASRFQAKHAIYFCIAVYVLAVVFATRMTTSKEFFILAIVVGCVQGGIQSLSRSFFSRLIPAGKSAEFFGFYNLTGKFSGLVGPAMVGLVALHSGNSRWGIGSIAGLFILGALLLTRVQEPAPEPPTV